MLPRTSTPGGKVRIIHTWKGSQHMTKADTRTRTIFVTFVWISAANQSYVNKQSTTNTQIGKQGRYTIRRIEIHCMATDQITLLLCFGNCNIVSNKAPKDIRDIYSKSTFEFSSTWRYVDQTSDSQLTNAWLYIFVRNNSLRIWWTELDYVTESELRPIRNIIINKLVVDKIIRSSVSGWWD